MIELRTHCYICSKVFDDTESESATAITDGTVDEDGFTMDNNEWQVFCGDCIEKVDKEIARLRREYQDEIDGGEQRFIDNMEIGICAAERNYTE